MPTASKSITRVDDIPTATVQCHASNLLQLPTGELLCVWFGGTQEGTSDISIYSSRLPPASASSTKPEWTEPVRISSDPDRSEQNPLLFHDAVTGNIWLLHTAQPAGNQDQSAVIVRKSYDQGRTWTEPSELFPGKKGAFIRQPMVVLPDGTWVLPIWHCLVPPGYRWIGSDDVSAVWYSRDQGATWRENAVPDSKGCVHMNIVALPDPTQGYVAFYRSRWADCIYRSTSTDALNWSAPVKTSLPNPNSGICAAALSNGDIVVVFNNSSAVQGMELREGLYDDITPASDTRHNQPAGADGKSAIWGTPRKALSVGLSSDNGQTWKFRVLEDGDGFCMTNNSKERSNRELSYPSIAVVGSSRGIHVAFTYWRLNIRHVYIDDIDAFLAEA